MEVKFDIISTIGQGGQGRVELCRDKETKLFFARKIILASTIDELNVSLQECLVLLQVSHPHIVSTRTFYLDEPKNGGYEINILYEFCNKSTLRGFINRFREKKEVIKFRQILSWIEQLCSAIEHIHSRKIIHRDLKPDNVMLSGSSFSVKLGDFGFSKRLDESREFAKSMLGTYFFTSPEIRKQEPYTKAVDIWGIYVILLDLLLPKTFDFSFELIANPKKIFKQIKSRYSTEISEFVKSLIQIDPGARPSAKELLQTIRGYRQKQGLCGHEELKGIIQDLESKEREIFLLKKELEHVSTSITFSQRDFNDGLGSPALTSPSSPTKNKNQSSSSSPFTSSPRATTRQSSVFVVGEDLENEVLTVTPPPLFTPMTAKVFESSEFGRSDVYKSFSERGHWNVMTVRDKEISSKPIRGSQEISGRYYTIKFHLWNRGGGNNSPSQVVALKRPTTHVIGSYSKQYKKMGLEKFCGFVRYNLVSKFDHPCIEKVIGVVNLKKEGYRLVAEGFQGGTLQSFILNHNFDLNAFQKVSFAFDIASAVLCFLSHGYVHTRLCTTLIMITDDRRNCKVVSTYFCLRVSGAEQKVDAKKHIFGPLAQIMWEIYFRRKFDGDYSNIEEKSTTSSSSSSSLSSASSKKKDEGMSKKKMLEEKYFEIIRFCLERDQNDFEKIHRVVYKLSKLKEIKWEAVKRKAMMDK